MLAVSWVSPGRARAKVSDCWSIIRVAGRMRLYSDGLKGERDAQNRKPNGRSVYERGAMEIYTGGTENEKGIIPLMGHIHDCT